MIDFHFTFTVGDFAALKALEDQWSEKDHELLPALRRKLERARVVFQIDLPRHVATIGSHVAYTIDRGEMQAGTLTLRAAPARLCLPVQLPLGLAILGRREGETFDVSGQQVHLHRVFEQPEASWPGRFQGNSARPAKTSLRLPGSGGPRGLDLVAAEDQDDDPGPSAA